MKIGIITYWHSLDNYGQQLQCFALQHLLRSWGHDAFLIRYKPKKENANSFLSIFFKAIYPLRLLSRMFIDTRNRKEKRYEETLRKRNLKMNHHRKFEKFL